jgi:hypothetical protein
MKGTTVKISLAIAAVAALPFIAAGIAVAAPAPLLLHPETGSALSYHVVFDGSFWNGAKTAFARDVQLTALGGGQVRVVSTGPAHDDGSTAQGTLRKNGEIDAAGASDRVRSFNTVVQVLSTAPAAIVLGTSWSASVPMQFNDTDATADFPVTVKVVADDAGGLILQGTGAQTVQTTYGGYPVPIDVDVRFAMRLTKNGFDRCDFAASEVVHAGPQTQTLSWKWAMAPTATVVGTTKT